jgi:hypothetical protein
MRAAVYHVYQLYLLYHLYLLYLLYQLYLFHKMIQPPKLKTCAVENGWIEKVVV